ncbi:MAG: MFS transporter [Caulobacteraceae bacterium]|nr:MFS transporter [Caulobacteraceae bacterium]
MQSADERSWFAGLSRNTFLLAAASFFSDVSTEMLYPVLPVFLTQTLKAGGGVVGLIEGLAVGIQNLVQGFSGALSDRLGRHRSVALVGFAISAVSKPLIGLASAWPGVLGSRLLDRVGAGTRSAPRDALVAASVAEADRGKAFGLEGAGDNAGAFVGPLIAVLLLAVLGARLRSIFYLAAVPGLLAFLMVLLVRKERPAAHSAAVVPIRLSGFPRAYGRYLIATAVFGIGNSSNAFLILQMQALGVPLSTTILIYAGFNLVAALVSYPAGALSDRLGRRDLLVASFLIFLASYLGFAFVHEAAIAAGLFVLYGAFQGMYRALGKSLASELSPPSLRASGVGWYGAVVGLSGLLASLIAGLLWDRVGHAAVFLYGAAVAIAGVLALLALTPGKAQPA